MNKIKENILYYVVMAITFYGVPLLVQDTGSVMVMMLVVMPLISLVTSIMYGIKNGFDLLYILIVMIMFIPTIFIFYNSSAWIYVIGYGMIALIGDLVALPFRKR